MKIGDIRFRTVLLGIAFAALVWGFRELLFAQLPGIFRNPQEDMSFGWYVPLFSLYVVWRERRELVDSCGAPSLVGLLATLPFLFLGFIGVRGVQVRFGVVAFAGLCLTLPWTMFGRATAKRLLFPCLFLLFCVPLATFLDVVTVHLRLFATASAYAVLKGVGAAVVRQGTMIASTSGSFAIDVAEPCSGLRSVFALLALTAGYAYFTQPTWLRRGILFALAVPLAVLGNVMRILTICLVGTYASGEFATGFYHDYSGYVVFFVAIVLMLACSALIDRVAEFLRPKKSAQPAVVPKEVVRPVSGFRGVFVPVLALLLVLPMMYLQSAIPEPKVCLAPSVRLTELPSLESEAVEISEAEKTVLPADTQLDKRLYRGRDGHWYLVTLVIGGRDKGSIHRPELCLPAQGYLMTRPRSLDVGGGSWRMLTLDGGEGRPSQGFAYTFFNQDGFRTASHVRRIFRDVWDRSVHGRIDRWVMVSVCSSHADERGLAPFLRLLKEVVR